MSLSSFAEDHFDRIMQTWETRMRRAVRSCRSLSQEQLRDHLTALLHAIIHNLERDPRGRPDPAIVEPTYSHLAHLHGADRRDVGFELRDVLAEYSTLRATVMELWRHAEQPLSPEDLDQVVAFNQAIDGAQAVSVGRYLDGVQHDQNLVLGVLGHDVRTPLMAIIMAAHVLDSDISPEHLDAAREQILRSSRRIETLVKDLLDFTFVRLKGHLIVKRMPMNLRYSMESLLREIRSAYPKIEIEFRLEGDLTGEWDEGRLAEMLSNLIVNAIQYRSPNTPIEVSASEAGDRVRLCVKNHGQPIPADRLPDIFDPLERAVPLGDQRVPRSSHLGIGLYIAQVIARAHGGNISVVSTAEEGTRFEVLLPRRIERPGSDGEDQGA